MGAELKEVLVLRGRVMEEKDQRSKARTALNFAFYCLSHPRPSMNLKRPSNSPFPGKRDAECDSTAPGVPGPNSAR